MPLSPSERLALEDAVEICNCIMSREHNPVHTAFVLTAFAALLVGDSPEGRSVLAWAMRRHARELDGDVLSASWH